MKLKKAGAMKHFVGAINRRSLSVFLLLSLIIVATGALAQAPTITSLSPIAGPSGTSVTITGTNFGTASGSVTFNGAGAPISSWGNTAIIAVVPGGASTGNVVVRAAAGQTSNGLAFTVPAPSVTSLSPTSGQSGTAVTITGTNFGTTPNIVSFNGASATISSWSNTSIHTTVPSAASTGNVVVRLAGGQTSNGVAFTVPLPTITSLSPTAVPVGGQVTIAGANFGSVSGWVMFNNSYGTINSWSNTSIVATNSSTYSGSVMVGNSAGSSNSVAFTVPPPSISSLSPTLGPSGTPVTITGTNFGTTSGWVTFNGTYGTISSWSNTSIKTTVPGGATTGNLVIGVAVTSSNGVNFTVPTPAITSLSPASGPVGSQVTITGTNFGSVSGWVKFNGTYGTIRSWSSTSIVVTVPDCTTGSVVVGAGNLSSNGVTFTVVPPSISSLSPTSGPSGTPVTITGTNFSATPGTVTFNGTYATISSWSNTSIVAIAPGGVTTGSVVVRDGSQYSNGVTFTVPAPSITNLSPTSGSSGTAVTITGTNFGPTTGTVTFNGAGAAISSWSNTSIVVTAPGGVTTGSVVVTAAGNQASNGVAFTVSAPAISSLSPTSGPSGTSVTITGTNFGTVSGKVTFNGAIATIISWSNTSVKAAVPAGATTGNVVVTASGNQASNGVAFTVPSPAITSLSPTSGPSGTSVTITGTNFGAASGKVIFNGVIATISSWTNTSILAAVPAGATSGNVVVTAAGNQTSNGVAFTIPSPTITSLSPASGPPNTSVFITGTNFGTLPGKVTFNGTNATVNSWSNTSIQTTIPAGATTGNVVVTASGSQASNGVAFTVLPPPPSIASLSPSSGIVGTLVTITGMNFGSTSSKVTFNGTSATISSWSNTSIVATVPNGASTGNVVVTANSETSNGVAFMVILPSITSLLPSSGSIGSQVAVKGANFGATSGRVTFNGTSATINIWSSTVIVATVPSGATTGNVGVTAGGETSNGVPFTVQAASGTNPVITWAAPSAITFGTALSATQLDATANVAGTFVYSPTAGTVLPAGNQALFVTFTPTDTTDYSTATASVPLTVNQATATMSLSATPTGQITFGTAVTITARVTPSAATGTVLFKTATTTLGTLGLASGSASLTTRSLPLGSNTITASYSGDANDSASSASVQAPISVTAETLAIVPSALSMPYGGPLPTPPLYQVLDAQGNGVPSNCYSGTAVTAIENDSNGNPLPSNLKPSTFPDQYPITVTGLGNFQVNTTTCPEYSASNVDITQVGTLAVVKDVPGHTDPSGSYAYGQSYGISFALSNRNGVPVTGNVLIELMDSNHVLLSSGTVSLSNGSTSWTPCGPNIACAVLAPGDYPVQTTYNGDTYNETASIPGTLSILKDNTITTVTNCPSQATINQSNSYNVEVASEPYTGPIPTPKTIPLSPSGSVEMDITLPSGNVISPPLTRQLSGSVVPGTSTATFSGVIFTITGNYSLQAIYQGTVTGGTYSGDDYYNSSTSVLCTFDVGD